jgi:hypothetical protein
LHQVEPDIIGVNDIAESRLSPLSNIPYNLVVSGVGVPVSRSACCRFTVANMPLGSSQGPTPKTITKAYWRSKTQIECERPVFSLAQALVYLEVSPNCEQFISDLN